MPRRAVPSPTVPGHNTPCLSLPSLALLRGCGTFASMSRFSLLSFATLVAVLPACSNTPTPADARNAMTQACVATAAVEAIAKGKQLPPQLDQLCSNPALQERLMTVVKEADELKNAIQNVLPHRDAGVVQ
jgi:hypothetical protein